MYLGDLATTCCCSLTAVPFALDPTENPKALKRNPFQAGRTAVDKFGIAHGRPSSGFLRRCRATLPPALCPCAVANDQGLFQDLGVVMGAAFGPCLFAVQFISLQKGNESFCAKDRGGTGKRWEKYSPHPPPILFPLLLLQTLAHARQRRGEGTGIGRRTHGGAMSPVVLGIFRIFQRMKKGQEMNSDFIWFIWFRHHLEVKA